MTLASLSRDSHLSAYRHPNCVGNCIPVKWMRTEAKLLQNSGRAGRKELLAAQVKRYSSSISTESPCQAYIDTAILIQRNARPIFEAWSEEFFLPQNSDRDQIPFAYVAAMTCPNLVLLKPRRPCTKRLCHWYVDRSVAVLHRTNFEERRRQTTKA